MIYLIVCPPVCYNLYKFFPRFWLPEYSSSEQGMTGISTIPDASHNRAGALQGAIPLPAPISSSFSSVAHLSQG